ncbi:hypothetical protein An04g06230 [Aspergillus niger]|uniref:Uncharacterized protein n=2 Tax=Aspergillus niger TaxID=5061 RepID=A2QJ90_ASPNC|nr:hypothetical protein An04g06230 [Aspergillus niger]CAK38884.1 hypothetical protein An04g06230 [Aspergillus niger]
MLQWLKYSWNNSPDISTDDCFSSLKSSARFTLQNGTSARPKRSQENPSHTKLITDMRGQSAHVAADEGQAKMGDKGARMGSTGQSHPQKKLPAGAPTGWAVFA